MSAINELERWQDFAEEDDVPALPDLADYEVQTPVTNPLRGLGRNDPCPCGSGRKYKRCCLIS